MNLHHTLPNTQNIQRVKHTTTIYNYRAWVLDSGKFHRVMSFSFILRLHSCLLRPLFFSLLSYTSSHPTVSDIGCEAVLFDFSWGWDTAAISSFPSMRSQLTASSMKQFTPTHRATARSPNLSSTPTFNLLHLLIARRKHSPATIEQISIVGRRTRHFST